MHGETVGKRRLPAPRQGSSLFWWQLQRPQTPELHVLRPRLLDLLDEATQAPMTVVVAPAGSGKTSLLASWCAQRPEVTTGWLSLEETDRSPGQFWTALCAVVDSTLRDCSGEEPGHDAASYETPQALRDVLAAVQGDRPDRVVVVVDNVRPLKGEDGCATTLEQLLGALPAWLHVVLCARRMPGLPVDRLRARGQLFDVLFDELRFTDAESREVVSRTAPWLPQAQVAVAAERAHGWAAGLQLSGLGAHAARAQGRDVRAAARTDLMVSDYIWHEVLAHESPDLISVLLDVSVVDKVTSPLASALADRDDAYTFLLEAESRGLLVTRLGEGDLVEIHHLLRDVLRTEAIRRDPVRVQDRHVRAARWFEERDNLDDVGTALEHWLASGQPRSALRLLARHVTELYDLGFEEMIATTLARLPASMASSDVDTQVDLAWSELLVDRSAFLDVVREAAAMASRHEHPPATTGRVRMLEAIATTMTGDWSQGGQQALESMQLLGDTSWADPFGRFGWNMVARDLALSERWDDDAPALLDAREALGRDPERRLSYEGIAAMGCALAGRPLDALRVAAGVSGYAQVRSMTILRLELATAEAMAHRELGDRERAEAELRSIVEGAVGPVTHVRALALLALVEACLDNADLEGARKRFGEADAFVRAQLPGTDGVSWLARRGLQLSLATGDLEAATRWNERVEDKFWQSIGRARLHLFRGEGPAAVQELSTSASRCVRHEVTRGLLLAQALPPGPEAMELYGSILPRAVGAGLMQTVASEGPEVLDVLEQHPWLAPEPWLAKVHHAVPPSRRTGITQIALPGEHLTDRELGVLRMLPSRLTIREIGEELGISVNTVKFHLRVIYRKLGVGSRNEAAAMARSLRRNHNRGAEGASRAGGPDPSRDGWGT